MILCGWHSEHGVHRILDMGSVHGNIEIYGWLAMDSHKMSMLIPLDLLTACDAIDFTLTKRF